MHHGGRGSASAARPRPDALSHHPDTFVPPSAVEPPSLWSGSLAVTLVGHFRCHTQPVEASTGAGGARTTRRTFYGCLERRKPPVETSAGGGAPGRYPQKLPRVFIHPWNVLRVPKTAAVPPAGHFGRHTRVPPRQERGAPAASASRQAPRLSRNMTASPRPGRPPPSRPWQRNPARGRPGWRRRRCLPCASRRRERAPRRPPRRRRPWADPDRGAA